MPAPARPLPWRLLYLRLILEKGLRPPQILVVTYTEAATKELRDRIRISSRDRRFRPFLEPESEAADDLGAIPDERTANGTRSHPAPQPGPR